MARAVSGYPGRKNLMWLSGSFPFEWSLTPRSDVQVRNSEMLAIITRESRRRMRC